MKRLAIITKTTEIKERKGVGFTGSSERSMVIRFLCFPVYRSTIKFN